MCCVESTAVAKLTTATLTIAKLTRTTYGFSLSRKAALNHEP